MEGLIGVVGQEWRHDESPDLDPGGTLQFLERLVQLSGFDELDQVVGMVLPRRLIEGVWNCRAVFGPSLPGPDWRADSATQYPTFLRLAVGLFGTAPDTTGQSAVDSARTVLSRDGTVVCESASQGLCVVGGAPVAGRYRMETEATRSLTDVSTKVGLVWTWTSDGSGGDRPASLPVRVVRFTPTLDEANSAPGDRTAIVPVQVLANPGAPAAKVTSLTVEVSYDDGKTWRREQVRGHGGDGVIVLRHPTGGYVSLRAKAVDSSGSTVEQTIIRAYRLR
ncbi:MULTISPECIES: hypothetical protein [Kribbella]|nr:MULTISPECIES: hypothetical protein [Kribbella]